MFWKRIHDAMQSVILRLTLLYIVLFTVLLALVFLLLDFSLRSALTQRTDAWLLQQMRMLEAFDGELQTDQKAKGFHNTINWKASAEGPENIFYLLLSKENDLFVSSDLSAWEGVDASILPAPVYEGSRTMHTLKGKTIACHSIWLPQRSAPIRLAFMRYPNGMTAVTGISTGENQIFIANIRKQFGFVFSAMLLFGGILGYIIARRAMSGVERVTRTALSIGKGDLDHRVALGREGLEIERLAIAFNNMLGRIQALVMELQEVTNNIAHDLRSPVTSIRGIAETALSGKLAGHRECPQWGAIVHECDRLIGMINTALEIAELDSGMKDIPYTQIDVTEILSKAYALFQPVAEDKQVDLQLSGGSKVIIQANQTMIQRAIANLLDNAVKFTPPGGRVRIFCRQENSHACIIVKDTGCGITEEEQKKIFTRFYRGDTSRSQPGNGLGLSLAQSMVKAHGGDIFFNSRPGRGSTFTIQLPVLEC